MDPDSSAAERPAAVSVVVPAYRAAPFIGEALHSVLAQSYADYEVLVVNDGSPDTPELEAALAPYGARITYLVKANGGVSSARNHAIRRARGEYLAFLDADDVWLPGYLESQMALLAARPELDLVYTDAGLFGCGPMAGRRHMELCPSSRPVDLEGLIAQRCVPAISCTVARRSRVVDAGLFDESLSHGEDFHLWVRLAVNGARMDFQPAVLGKRRVHAGAETFDRVRHCRGAMRVYEKLLSLPGFPERLRPVVAEKLRQFRAEEQLELGKRLLLDRQYRRAAAAFAGAGRAGWKLRAIRGALAVWPELARTLARVYYRRLDPTLEQAAGRVNTN